MKKLLLVVGVVCLAACVLFLLAAVLHLLGYYGVHDGSPELYDRMHQRMIVCFLTGVVLAAAGAICMIVRAKL